MKKLLIFHSHAGSGNAVRMSPAAYYMESDCLKSAVRIYAGSSPKAEAKFDIFDDGVSIFQNRAVTNVHATTGVISKVDDVTSIVLSAGETHEELAENFTEATIAKGSWVYCNQLEAGGGGDYMVQLELKVLSEDEESEE